MPYQSDKQRRFMHARHPGIAARWDQEIHESKKKGRVSKMQPRYGGAGTRGHRITGDDSAIEKKYPSKEEPKTAAHRTHQIASKVGLAAGMTAIGTGVAGGYDDQFENINRHAEAAGHMKFENDTARMKGFKGRWSRGQKAAVHGIIAGQNMRKRPLGAVTTGAQLATVGSLGTSIAAGSKYGKEQKARAARTRAANKAKKLAAAGATEDASKAAPRYYDDENRRQRRLGQYQGVLGLGGAAAAGEGGRRIYQDTKKLRDLTVREDAKGATAREGVHVPLRSSKAGKGAVSLKKLPVGLVAGGAAGLTGATVIRRHAESNRGAPYR